MANGQFITGFKMLIMAICNSNYIQNSSYNKMIHFKFHLFIQPVEELTHFSWKSCPSCPIEFKEPVCVLTEAGSEVVHQVLVGDSMELSSDLLNEQNSAYLFIYIF